MDMRKIKKLIELIKETGIAEIEIREGEESVRISQESSRIPQFVPQPVHTVFAPSAAEQHAPERSSSEAKPAELSANLISANKHVIRAPMVGTVYLSSSPGAKPFVEVGQMVKAGDVLCLIEAMKMFNQIEADKSGTVSARLVESGIPVEFNQPLFVIE
ncbi:MAG: acetyl-CoA carboxylase, biotin carboxyl carrier protein [Gammaproteobacteria bacterium RIFCSPHIGHO2_12_FULL_41_20]|nr:MAG: acetyl-CoA carboxylase, biotin carboxyl carrier protein [Gammaproteobacteria bacterium RIFCSPHIGHO2_12_FULL_41_20]